MPRECLRCGTQFMSTYSLKRHLTTKKSCEPIRAELDRVKLLEDLNKPQTDHKCVCGKSYSRAFTKKRHQMLCTTYAKANDDARAANIGINNGTAKISQDVHNDVYNINVNIVNNFGEENLGYLSSKFMKSCVLNRVLGFVKWAEHVHFNPDHPENRNIWLENRFENRGRPIFVTVMEKGKPQVRVANDVFDALRAHAADEMSEFALNNRELFDQEIDELTDYWLDFRPPTADKKLVKRVNQLIAALLLSQTAIAKQNQKEEKEEKDDSC